MLIRVATSASAWGGKQSKRLQCLGAKAMSRETLYHELSPPKQNLSVTHLEHAIYMYMLVTGVAG